MALMKLRAALAVGSSAPVGKLPALKLPKREP